VNENLPTRILYSMAKSYLQDEFEFRISSDVDLNLEFEGRLLSRLGILEDVSIVSGSVVIVLYPIKPPVSGESPTVPSAKFGPSYGENRSMRVNQEFSPQPIPVRVASNHI
jgi:hypothetical protein